MTARRIIALCFAALLAAGPAWAQTPPAEAGSSIGTAIVLSGIQHETQGVDAEYAYIKKNHPGAKLKAQSLIPNKGRQYDAIQITNPDMTIFFDITAWFGK